MATPIGADSGPSSKELLAFVANIPSWQGVDPDSVEVQNLTEGGGNTTALLTLAAKTQSNGITGSLLSEPRRVVVHIRSMEDPREAQFRCTRMAAAQGNWSAIGLAPKRLAEGENWWVDEFLGKSLKKILQSKKDAAAELEAEAFELGAWLARLHAAPLDWFDAFREEFLHKMYPILGDLADEGALPKNSPMWVLLARSRRLWTKLLGDCGGSEAIPAAKPWPTATLRRFCEYLKDYESNPFLPSHPALRRVVCLHGDLHSGNMVKDSKGALYAVDYEFACVGPAVYDLMMVLPCFEHRSLKAKVIEGYLRYSGESESKGVAASDEGAGVTPEDVTQILLDYHLFCWAYWQDDVGWFDVAGQALSEDEIFNEETGILSVSDRLGKEVREKFARDGVVQVNGEDFAENSSLPFWQQELSRRLSCIDS
eukprot:TRINITY_DN104082_c0_g1_i1.p1 TRINITY_DN104082_c0_g1~~TRINITY_DN104082_c0_g1_i1.p1  ORF type:complete len:426 (+),score=67.10 TRINITY_DN104082_c0_g1_i1:196-1473(+)